MENEKFDRIAKLVASGTSRRVFFRGLTGGVLAGVLGKAVQDSEAKSRGKGHDKGKVTICFCPNNDPAKCKKQTIGAKAAAKRLSRPGTISRPYDGTSCKQKPGPGPDPEPGTCPTDPCKCNYTGTLPSGYTNCGPDCECKCTGSNSKKDSGYCVKKEICAPVACNTADNGTDRSPCNAKATGCECVADMTQGGSTHNGHCRVKSCTPTSKDVACAGKCGGVKVPTGCGDDKYTCDAACECTPPKTKEEACEGLCGGVKVPTGCGEDEYTCDEECPVVICAGTCDPEAVGACGEGTEEDAGCTCVTVGKGNAKKSTCMAASCVDECKRRLGLCVSACVQEDESENRACVNACKASYDTCIHDECDNS